MHELAAVLKGLNFEGVQTYIQSGNVVFQTVDANFSELSDMISAAVGTSHGFRPRVLLLELWELENAIAANPYPQTEIEPRTLHLYFLESAPQNPDLELLENLKTDSERFRLDHRVFYLHAPDGIGRSKLAARVEGALGVPATARNWRTVSKVMALAKPEGGG